MVEVIATILDVVPKSGPTSKGGKWECDELFLQYNQGVPLIPTRIKFFKPHPKSYSPKKNDLIRFNIFETNFLYPRVSDLEKIGEHSPDEKVDQYFHHLESIFSEVRENQQKFLVENEQKLKEQKKKQRKAAAELSKNFWEEKNKK